MNPEGSREQFMSPQQIKGPEKSGNKAEFIPQRGGHIAWLKLHNKDILRADPMGLLNPKGKIRGGMPILFPNAGKAEGLPQHGFVRDSNKWTHSVAPDGQSFTEFLHSDEETEKIFPYKFIFEVGGRFERDRFIVSQSVQNLSDRDMPVSFGLHPYFPVNSADKSKIKFNFAGGEELERRRDEWMNGKAVSINNPKKHALNAEMRISIPGLGELVLEASDEYQKIWVWSEPGQNFICIEPVMRDSNGLDDDPQMVAPSKFYSAYFSIELER